MMSRKDTLLKLFENVDGKELLVNSIDELLFLEEQLETLKALPHVKYHPEHPDVIKRTEAGKLYKEYLQQYNNIVRTLTSILTKNGVETEDSPLRAYFRKLQGGK